MNPYALLAALHAATEDGTLDELYVYIEPGDINRFCDAVAMFVLDTVTHTIASPHDARRKSKKSPKEGA